MKIISFIRNWEPKFKALWLQDHLLSPHMKTIAEKVAANISYLLLNNSELDQLT